MDPVTEHPGLDRQLHLRVGTSQRERALAEIRNAAADERITFDELEGRVPRALGAVTRADLASVLEDLLPRCNCGIRSLTRHRRSLRHRR